MVTRKAIQSEIGKIEANRCGDETVPLPVYGKRKRNREAATAMETGSNAPTVCPRRGGYCHG